MVFEVLGDVIHQLTARRLVGHGLVELACHESLSHRLLPPLPKKDRHLLALHKHCPHHELMEGVLKSADLRVVNVDIDLLLLLLYFFLAFWARLVILVKFSEICLIKWRPLTWKSRAIKLSSP